MKVWQIAGLVLTVLVMLQVTHRPDDAKEFEQWKEEFGMSFSQEEEIFRKIIFFENLRQINRHNADSTQNYKKGLNQFSHLTPKEFEQMFLSTIYADTKSASQPIISEVSENNLREIDWHALGMVSGVKDQGVCDAGYAFCSSSLIESFYLFNKQTVLLSEQQIIDCATDYTTFGCQGGSRNGTLIYIREKGLNTAASYPYKGVKNNCQKETGEYKPGYTHIEFNGCDDKLSGLYKAPMTVAVNAKEWMTYKSGIFDGCSDQDVNHDTYLIGANDGYWRLKNSWGQRWGEYGFIRLKSGNTCKICDKPGFSFKR